MKEIKKLYYYIPMVLFLLIAIRQSKEIFSFAIIGICCGMGIYLIGIEIVSIKKELKLKKFLSKEEYIFYSEIKDKDFKTKKEQNFIQMIKDFQNGNFYSKSDYEYYPLKNEYLLDSFKEKYGEIDPESLLK